MRDALQNLQHRQATEGQHLSPEQWATRTSELLEKHHRDMLPETIAAVEKFIVAGRECLESVGGLWDRDTGDIWFSSSVGIMRVYFVRTQLTEPQQIEVYKFICDRQCGFGACA